MDLTAEQKGAVLIEALPYIRKFHKETIVIKYGGHAMVDEKLKKSFALNVILLKYIGVNVVVVHGGGPQIGQTLKRMNIPTSFVNGLRVTDEETLDVVEMVLVGKVNKEIVNLINQSGGLAVGLSGKDGGLIRAKKMTVYQQLDENKPPEIIDIGMVGEVEQINPAIIDHLSRHDFIPIIAPVGVDREGLTYNINADLVAGKVAAALSARKLILLTDVPGVLDKKGELVSSIDILDVDRLIETQVITGGMIPKVNCCADALRGGVKKAHIIDGRRENAVLLELFTDKGVGTEICHMS
ncbi:MAG: acetylglutamate kinase [Deltaproteobacteria bacterium]|nr:acetylglutamate kinase [Deltaproteobacteria bacterium]